LNERIKELILEAGFPEFGKMYVVSDGEELKRFAELIVRECVKEMSQQMYWHRIDESNNPNFYKAVEKTLKHFGVE